MTSLAGLETMFKLKLATLKTLVCFLAPVGYLPCGLPKIEFLLKFKELFFNQKPNVLVERSLSPSLFGKGG